MIQKLRPQQSQNPEQNGYVSRNFSLSLSRSDQQKPIPLNELMLHLSRYRELKQLPLNPISETKDQLWRDSPCTIRCTNRNVSMDRIEKFKIGSIYHKDNINEQKKVFTQTQKPELLLKNFRRQVEEAEHSKNKYRKKLSNPSSQKSKITDKLGKTMPLLQNKFYHIPQKTQLRFDRNGTRSTFEGEYNVKKIIDKLRTTRPNFTSSRRIDLALPLNFNPGPGKYFSNNPEEFVGCKTYTSRNKRTLSKINMTERQQSTDFAKEHA